MLKSELWHEKQLARLKKMRNFEDIYNDAYYQEYFVKRYVNDIPRLAYEVFGTTFTFQQMDIWNKFVESGGWVGGRLAVASGHGCFGKGHKVRLFNGESEKVEDIKVGDIIMGDDGSSPRLVLSLKRGVEELYEFEFDSGDKHIYNKSHILVLVSTQSYGKQKSGDIIEVKVGDWLLWSDRKKRTHCIMKCKKNISRNAFKIRNRVGMIVSDQSENIHFGIRKVTSLGSGKYYGFTIDGNNRFLSEDNIILRNTGKTKFIGNISAGFLLLFRKSIVRIQAPKQEQVTKFSFKEIQSSLDNTKKERVIGDDLRYIPKWGFLTKFIQFNNTLIYIKGYKTKWYIEASTAPKGDPTNLSGQHNEYYLLIMDEASGIEDTHIEASLGGLSERFNSCIMFSQHTRLQGKFHNFISYQNVEKGGVWHTLRLSSIYSPRVDKKQLLNWFSTYTEDEIRVRVKGLPPEHQSGTLISDNQAYSLYENDNTIFKDSSKFDTLIFSYDLGYTGYRDSSVVSISEAYAFVDDITKRVKKNFKLMDIYRYNGMNGKLPMEFIQEVFKIILKTIDTYSENGIFFNRIVVIGDATAGGKEPFVRLEEMFLELGKYDIEFKGLMWGSERLYFEDKQRFINARAKAFVNLKEVLEERRFKAYTQKSKDATLNELKNIFYSFDSKFRYKILSKEEMKKKGVNSPDIGDTLAQMMLIDFEDAEVLQNFKDNQQDDELIEMDIFDDVQDDEIIDINEDENCIKNEQFLPLPSNISSFDIDDEF